MENVRGLLSMPLMSPNKRKISNSSTPDARFQAGSLVAKLVHDFNAMGYHVDVFVVNAVNYGAPQVRERVFLVGNRFGYAAEFPSPTHSNRVNDHLLPFKTLEGVIGPHSGFVDPNPAVMNFSPRKLKYLSMIPQGGNWRHLPVDIQRESMGKAWYLKGGRSAYWRRLSFDFPSPTILTMPNHSSTSLCHPVETRAISVGEAAAIQEFPRDWMFYGSTASQFKQVGNAVPIRLGCIVGHVAYSILEKIRSMGHAEYPQCSSSVTHIRPHVRTRTFWKNGTVLSNA